MKNSKVYEDHRGEYIVVERDEDGNEFKVYITRLNSKNPPAPSREEDS